MIIMNTKKFYTLATILFTFLTLAACNQAGSQPTPPVVQEQEVVPVAAVIEEPTAVIPAEAPAVEDIETSSSETSDVSAIESAETSAEPAATAEVASTEPVESSAEPQLIIEPIEVTYFTPSQQEGPYYPTQKLADQDNDLTVVDGAAGSPDGAILEFEGRVYDSTGMPLETVTVEIWQTDGAGIYLHPQDPSTDNRDQNFQFYGESVTTADGRYSFRTIMPVRYEPRPVHIHVIVRADGQKLLTTQFYFADDPSAIEEGLNQGDNMHMLIDISNGLIGQRDIVLSTEAPAYYPDLSNQTEPAQESAVPVAVLNPKINLNNMTGDALQSTIPEFGQRMVREFFEYQPYISIQQFRREIGKYVSDAQIADYEQYVFVPIDVDASDGATLMQVPGIDESLADTLIEARPYGLHDQFLEKLGEFLTQDQVNVARTYLKNQ
jgi:protocatechuate 3,4-dioxygenase beta subunit